MSEKFIKAFETAKNFFSPGSENTTRNTLLATISDRLKSESIAEERASQIEEEVSKIEGKRSIKWSKEAIENVTAKQYAVKELEDKIASMSPGLARAAYEEMLSIVQQWKEMPLKAKCPHRRCNTAEYVVVTQNEAGKYVCNCINPAHVQLAITAEADTEEQAILNWNTFAE